MNGNAVVTINPLPAVFNVTGGGGYCAGGPGVNIGLSGSAPGVDYKLYRGASLINTAGGTGASVDFGQVAAAGTYTVLATDATSGCSMKMNGSAVITINALPAVYAVTGGGSYCARWSRRACGHGRF